MSFSFKKYRYAIGVAVLIGLLYGLPHIFFLLSLKGEYRGIPLLATPNEGSYLARIQEIIDGHGTLGSPFLFEYKNGPPLSPPVGEWLYALSSIALGVSPATVLVASKFILPAILFLLVYALVLRLTETQNNPLNPPLEKGGRREEKTAAQKLAAITGGLLVVLGYDLVDYRTVWSYLSGVDSPESFLLWARPVNPILGALFLFSFLLLLWSLFRKREKPASRLWGAGLFLALMFWSYFFSWGIALSVLFVLTLLVLLRKEYKTAGVLALIVPFGALLSSPYWFSSWRAAGSPWYEESVLRSGLFLTHYPLLNKLILAALAFFVLALLFDFFLKKRRNGAFALEPWHSFSLALLLGGLWAYSQQVVTGRTIWPYHFVQYTIPFVFVVGVVVLHRIVRPYGKHAWAALVSIAVLAPLLFGVYTQMSAYATARPIYAAMQSYAPLFAWLNRQESDCVVFTDETSEEMQELNTLIPAFTHCNRYVTTELSSLLPADRAIHSYLSLLRLRGISGESVEDYLQTHQREAVGYLYSNWQGLFGVKDFPDFRDELLLKRMREFPEHYRAFLKKDFRTELGRYELDFLLSDGPLSERVAGDIGGLKKVSESGWKTLYSFK